MGQYRFASINQNDDLTFTKNSFIDLLVATNGAAKDDGEEKLFGEPTFMGTSRDYENRYCEFYPEAIVLGPLPHNDDGWRVIPETKRAYKYCRLGAIAIGYPNVPEEEE